MICIATITKADKFDGAFLALLFSPLRVSPDQSHRLDSLHEIWIHPAGKKSLPESAERGIRLSGLTVGYQSPLSSGRDLYAAVRLACQEWNAREQVLPFRGWEIWADKTFAAPCQADEYLYQDLTGCLLCDPEGVPLGRVVHLMEGGSQLILEVDLTPENDSQKSRKKPASALLPFHKNLIGKVDTEKKCIYIDDLEYFQDLVNH